MVRFQDTWLTHQQQRFMRPDAPRYLRNDAARYRRADASRWLPPGGDELSSERKFDPDQPRVPAGSPDGGQWTTDGGGSGTDVVAEVISEVIDFTNLPNINDLFELFEGTESSELSTDLLGEDAQLVLVGGKGHHYVPRQVFENGKYSFSRETLNVFENAATGRLLDPTSNLFDEVHRKYNTAVGEALDRFLDRNNIRSDRMTPDQARQFVDEIRGSRDPRIQQFNMRLWRRELFQWYRRWPGRGGEA